MNTYATIEEAIDEARRQREEAAKESPDSRNLVFQTAEGSYGAHTVPSSETAEFGSEYALAGEITSGGEYWEYDREVLRENGLKVID